MACAAIQVVASSPRYLRVEFEAGKALTASVDDGEFYFTPGDALVQFRCSRRSGPTDFGANRRRMDGIRLALNFESVSIRGGARCSSSQNVCRGRAIIDLPSPLPEEAIQEAKNVAAGGLHIRTLEFLKYLDGCQLTKRMGYPCH